MNSTKKKLKVFLEGWFELFEKTAMELELFKKI